MKHTLTIAAILMASTAGAGGLSDPIVQPQKELDRYDHDGRSEMRRGWIAMDEMLILQNLINLAKARSS